MRNVLLPIVTVALLVCGPAAAGTRSPDPSCASGGREFTAPRHAMAPARRPGPVHSPKSCVRAVNAQFSGPLSRSLSDKEIEQALKRQGFHGRLVEMIPNGVSEVKVLWETQEGGKRKYRTLIVDAKTGKFKREERR